jgi:hypothetical protein
MVEVLQRKGFSETWISQVKQVVRTGRVCININSGNNGSLGPIRAHDK